MESARTTPQHVVIVWPTEGVGITKIVGPFTDEAEAKAHRARYPLATHMPLTPPEAER